jgi:hypothetical protein
MLTPTSTPAQRRYTGVFCEMIDYDRLYESVSDRAILVNNFNMRSDEDKEKLNRLLYTEYDGDTLDAIPTCDCGRTTGEYNKGIRCTNCGTVVVAVTERPMESILWVRAPEGVTAFISPAAWNVLNGVFTYRGVQMVRWLTDPTYVAKNGIDKQDALFHRFRDMDWKRSINYFIEHFDTACQVLLDHQLVRPIVRRKRTEQFIEENRHRFFPKYLPIPNRSIFVTEKTPIGTYADNVMYSAIDAVRTMTSLDSGIMPSTQRVKENRTVKVVQQLSSYYMDFTKNNLSKKPGMFRRQVYGSRLDFSGRAVISSLSHPHRYDELHFPWGLAVMMLKTHITSKLLKRGMTPSQAEELLMVHTTRYHPLLDTIFQELLEESPQGRIPVIFQRNPSLVRGSAQQLYISRIKGCGNPEEVGINTISFSVLALAAPNADFDGDEMNCELLIDQEELKAFSRLAPHLGVLDTHAPFKISGNIKLPGPIMSTIVSWMHMGEE